jgi:fumarate reductase subunit C
MGQALNSKYRKYHPKWYRRRMPIFWWLRRLSYARFIARELTSVAVVYTSLLLLMQIWALGQGQETYEGFLTRLASPPLSVLNVVVVLVLLFHTVTWLNLAPKALVVHLGKRRIPDVLVVAGHYFAWLIVSIFVGWILLGL